MHFDAFKISFAIQEVCLLTIPSIAKARARVLYPRRALNTSCSLESPPDCPPGVPRGVPDPCSVPYPPGVPRLLGDPGALGPSGFPASRGDLQKFTRAA